MFQEFDELVALMNEAMMKSMQPATLDVFIFDIVLIEQAGGFRFASADLFRALWKATDLMLDSYISNEFDTEQPALAREGRIAEWNSMRPSVQRRAELARLVQLANMSPLKQ